MADLSGTRGAKQLVVVMTHAMFSAPSRLIAARIASISVLSSSPSRLFSNTTGTSPNTNISCCKLHGHIKRHTYIYNTQ